MTDTNERPGLARAEPPPVPNASPAIADLVIQDMLDRKAAGIAKYGVPLQANNGRDPLVDAYQESLDLAVYLRQAIAEQWVRREEHDRVLAELDASRDTAAKYQRRHAGLRGLQTAVIEVTKRLVGKHGEEVDAAIGELTEALRRSTAVGDPMPDENAAKALERLRSDAAAAEYDRRVGERLPSIATLRQWMHDKTPIHLTFAGGADLIAAGYLPADMAIHRGAIAGIHDRFRVRSVLVQLPSGMRWAFSLDGNRESECAFPWLTSIGVRRDTVAEPCPRLTKAYADLGVEAPVQRADVWVKATDPVVETWVDREIELTTAHMAPTPVRLLEVRQDTIVVQEAGVEGEQVIERQWFEVRLISEVSK